MNQFSRLATAPALRPGGDGRTEREYLEFVVDGQPLGERVKQDVITPLGWGALTEQVAAIDRFLHQGSPDMLNERRSLYVCPECGDLGCPTLGVSIDRMEESVVWHSFAWATPYGDPADSVPLELGPFCFERESYEALFEGLRSDLVRKGV